MEKTNKSTATAINKYVSEYLLNQGFVKTLDTFNVSRFHLRKNFEGIINEEGVSKRAKP